MVIQRTIDHMKTRPRDERAAFAGLVAVGVVILLLLGWAIFFIHNLRSGPASPSLNTIASSTAEMFNQSAPPLPDTSTTDSSAQVYMDSTSTVQ